jgi:hypothetical protein
MTRSRAIRELEDIKTLLDRARQIGHAPEHEILYVANLANNLSGRMNELIRQVKNHWSDEE